MDNPEYIVMVALDTPSRETGIYISGGVMAAPTVGAVMEAILPYLGVERKYSDEDPAGQEVLLEDMTGLTPKEAEKKLKALGLTAVFRGNGETVTAQLPEAGQSVPGGSGVLLYLDDGPEAEMVRVPNFFGMNRQEAADAAGVAGLYILVTGNESIAPNVTVTAQNYEEETEVPRGTTITLTFTDTTARD